MKDPTGYKLRSGDQIRIMVNGEPDATVDVSLGNYGGVRPLISMRSNWLD